MVKLAAIILAAGHGKRMKSEMPKVLHKVGGEPMVLHVIRQARDAGADPIVVVVGHMRELLIPIVEESGVDYAVQEEQLGTGHAVGKAKRFFEEWEGEVIVLSGDVPLLSGETISRVLEYHEGQRAIATVITARAPDPLGYGRVLRSPGGDVEAIREHKDCSPEELKVDEINSGIYVFNLQRLFAALERLDNVNVQGEYYLTDVFQQFFSAGDKVAAFAADFEEIQGVNNPEDLDKADSIYRRRLEAT